ncbi:MULTISPECIES: toprim domain-containing protein [Methylomonas]|uniref:toprim domain-containing protein n=1 Tax=Methylomonas TaxID=416 RepID=UPI0014052F8F|nr:MULTISPECIES: toprim domain-containing protein [Methylomonas]
MIEAFKAAMQESGIEPPPDLVADGVLHRYHISGHKPGSLNGAYLLHLDGYKPAGYAENFKTGVKITWKSDGQLKPTTEAERSQQEARKQQNEQRQQEKQQRAALQAGKLWAQAKEITERDDHPYLIQKGVDANGLRLLPAWIKRINQDGEWRNLVVKNVLIVPLVDIHGKLHNLQAIFPNIDPTLGRDKDFLPGGRMGGLFHCIGQPTAEKIICEGYSTGASLYKATGLQTFCAMSAGNLLAVAQLVRKHRPTAKIVIAADNDEKTAGNPGLKAAKVAALAVGGLLAVPPMAGDFNDYAASFAGEAEA